MSRYRDRLRIIADILVIVSRQARKTQIMYKANLSYRLLCRYLDRVLDAGLVSFENEDYYALTDKGKEFLDRHEAYSKRCRRLEASLNHASDEKMFLENMCYGVDTGGNDLSRRNRDKGSRK